MPLRGLRFAFVGENIVIDAVGEVFAGEGVAALVDLSVLGPGVVVLHVIDHLAPAVADAQLVVAVLVRVLRVIGMHPLIEITIRVPLKLLTTNC